MNETTRQAERDLSVGDVILCAKSAAENGHTFLARELLQLAEELLPGVDHEGTSLSRLAVEAVEATLPALDLTDDAATRHVYLEGGTR